jgi:hypothetical protein
MFEGAKLSGIDIRKTFWEEKKAEKERRGVYV